MAIQDKFNKANVIYKITKDIDLKGETLTIPEGCTLDFQGGSFSNGTIVGDNTALNAIGKIFKNIDISGLWNVDHFNILWFGADNKGVTDVSSIVNRLISNIHDNTVRLINNDLSLAKTIYFPSGTYLVLDPIIIKSYNQINGFYTSVNIIGENMGSVIFITDTDGINGVFYGEGVVKAEFRNFTITNRKWSSGNRNSGVGFYFPNMVSAVDISNILVRGFEKGFHCYSIDSKIHNIYARECNIGIYISGTSTSVSNCYANYCKNDEGNSIGYVLKLNYSVVHSCACDDCDTAYYIRGGANMVILGCGAERTSYGAYIESIYANENEEQIYSVTIDNCIFFNNVVTPLFINNRVTSVTVKNMKLDVTNNDVVYGDDAVKRLIYFENCQYTYYTGYPIIKYPRDGYGRDYFLYENGGFNGELIIGKSQLYKNTGDSKTTISGSLYLSLDNGKFITLKCNVKHIGVTTNKPLKADLNCGFCLMSSADWYSFNTSDVEYTTINKTISISDGIIKLDYTIEISTDYYEIYSQLLITCEIYSNSYSLVVRDSTIS